MINNTESFDSGIPAGYAIATYRNTGTNRIPTVTWNATYSAVDISQSGNSHGQWRFQNPPLAYPLAGCLDFDVTLDLELLTGGTGEYHLGFHLRSGNGEEVWQLGHYRTVASNSSQEGVWYGQSGGGWNSGNESVGFANYIYQPITMGGRYLLRVVRETGSNIIRFYVNGVQAFTYSNILASQRLLPDFFIYNTNVRIHAVTFISSYSDPTIMLFGSCTLSRLNSETKEQSAPWSAGLNQYWKSIVNGLPTLSHKLVMQSDFNRPPLRSELGFIRGSVTRKGNIAVGQHLVCLNSRFNLVAETVSAADGSYRFDSLSMYDTYIVIAQDNFDFKYAPVGADRRTPEAYS